MSETGFLELKPLNTDTVTQSPLQYAIPHQHSVRLVIMVGLFQPADLVRQAFDFELNV